MKLILREDVYNLGNSGEVVNGEGRLRAQLPVAAEPRDVGQRRQHAQLEHEKKVIELRQAKLKGTALEQAKKLENVTVTVRRKVGDQNKLYGSVTGLDIAEGLAAQGTRLIVASFTWSTRSARSARSKSRCGCTLTSSPRSRSRSQRRRRPADVSRPPSESLFCPAQEGLFLFLTTIHEEGFTMEMMPSPRVHEDLAAERAVLGAIVMDNSVLTNVAEHVIADDFANAAHAQIFAAMLALDSKQSRIDPLTLAEELKVRGELASVGGPAYLQQLDSMVPFSNNAVEYARIIKNQSTRRSLALAGREIMELASQETGEVLELLDEAGRKVFAIAEKRQSNDLRPMSDLMDEALSILDKMKKSTSGITGTATGFVDLDNQLTGLHGGELIVLAARPGIGKTSLAMNIALHVAGPENRAAAVFSLEMPSAQLVMRMLATHARIDMKKLRGGRLSPADEERIQTGAAELFNLKVFVDDSGGLSSFDLRAKARRLKQKEPSLGLIVIDYLQLMHQKGKVESRQLEVSEISRGLKQLAKELDVPIIALSQLNRKVEERKGGKPMLSDLRESGAIEQDADVVMFIHREEEEGADGAPPASNGRTAIPCELIVAKQRNGPVGSIDLVFMAEYTRFESRARDWQGGD